jgi:hypothetical protein
VSQPAQAPCGPGADNRYCPVFWEMSAKVDQLHALIRELLENTGLDEDEQAEWLDRAGVPGDG